MPPYLHQYHAIPSSPYPPGPSSNSSLNPHWNLDTHTLSTCVDDNFAWLLQLALFPTAHPNKTKQTSPHLTWTYPLSQSILGLEGSLWLLLGFGGWWNRPCFQCYCEVLCLPSGDLVRARLTMTTKRHSYLDMILNWWASYVPWLMP